MNRSIFATVYPYLVSTILLLLLVQGCNRSEHNESSDTPPSLSSASATEPLPDGWSRIRPGGATVCSDGSEFSYFARPGEPSKVLFYLEGGGGCWTGDTCSADRFGTFKATVGDSDPALAEGIFDLTNEENPFKDHSMVYVPYCTGDVHLGDRERTYEVAALEDPAEGKEGANPEAHQVTIRHRGHDNVMAVLDWVYENFESPAQIFVTGSSAGSIPSPYYAAHLKGHYSAARVAQLGDGSGGYRREAGGPIPYEPWGTLDAIDAEPAFVALDGEAFDYEALYTSAAAAYPELAFASFDTAEDATQLRFLALGGATADSLQPLLDANLADIKASASNFHSFVAGGDLHVILTRPEFYLYAVDGMRIRDWVAALDAGEAIEDVHCDPCTAPESEPGGAATGD